MIIQGSSEDGWERGGGRGGGEVTGRWVSLVVFGNKILHEGN